MKHLSKCLAAILMLAACAGPNTTGSSGSMRVAVSWPRAGFKTQAIPAEARSITVSVSGQGLERPRHETLSRNGSETQTLVIDLPLGSKQVEVKAFNGAGNLVAEDRQSVEIVAHQTARLAMSLQTVQPQPSDNPGSNPGNPNPPGSVNPPGGDTPSTGASSKPGSPNASAEPSARPSGQPSAQPTATPSPTATSTPSGGGGGGGGGGGTPTSTTTDALSFTPNPTTISGIGFSTQLKLVFSDPTVAAAMPAYLGAHPSALVWTCTDGGGNTGCGAFTATNDALIWTWTANAAGAFTLRADVTGSSKSYTHSASVTVVQGSGTLNPGSGGFDGGDSAG